MSEEVGAGEWYDSDGVHRQNLVRKTVSATNIAETSINVPYLGYVIDWGKSKRALYDCQTRQESLTNDSIYKATATQLAGRTGRTRSGVVYRINIEDHYTNVIHETRFLVLARCNQTSLVLKLTVIGLKSVLKFEFIDWTQSMAVLQSFWTLNTMGHFWRWVVAICFRICKKRCRDWRFHLLWMLAWIELRNFGAWV